MGIYLALDLGATSGRAVLGSLEQGRLRIEELHRFSNEIVDLNGRLHWDVLALYREIKVGIHACARKGHAPQSLGVDTWGVDFGLLDRAGELAGMPVSYRDARTVGAMEAFFQRVPRARVYELTGCQFLALNTLYQVYSLVRDRAPVLDIAADLLFLPDLLGYMLTGRKYTEYTIASTSQLLNARTRAWEPELFAALGLPISLMHDPVRPGTEIGPLRGAVAQEVGLDLSLIAVASHDTASAVAAAPAEGRDWAYISSGTWSLMGVESEEPILSPQALELNLTNEGGVGGFRVLKNIAGMWLLEQCRRGWGAGHEYGDLLAAAAGAPAFKAILYPDAADFFAPDDMPQAISEFCRRTGQASLDTPAEVVRAILEGLALRYRMVLEELRQVYRHPINRLHIIGGGSRNRLLCQFAADATGLPVTAGPVEATAIGNLLVQAMASGEVGSVAELRRVVAESFTPEYYEPQASAEWERAYTRFRRDRSITGDWLARVFRACLSPRFW